MEPGIDVPPQPFSRKCISGHSYRNPRYLLVFGPKMRNEPCQNTRYIKSNNSSFTSELTAPCYNYRNTTSILKFVLFFSGHAVRAWLFICCKSKLKKNLFFEKLFVCFTKYALFEEKNVFVWEKSFKIENFFTEKKNLFKKNIFHIC